MSGYRAAPEGARISVMSRGRDVVWYEVQAGDWIEVCTCCAVCDGLESDALDALYWSRTDALESAAQACEMSAIAVVDPDSAFDEAWEAAIKHVAAEIRKLKEQQ